jgi:hypothetical protein
MAGKGTPSKLSLKKKTRPLPEVMLLNLNLTESLKPSSGESGGGEDRRIFLFRGPDLEHLSLMAVKEANLRLCDPDFTSYVLSRKVLSERWGAGNMANVHNRYQTVAVCLPFIFAVVFDFNLFPVPPRKAKLRNRQNRQLGRCFFFSVLKQLTNLYRHGQDLIRTFATFPSPLLCQLSHYRLPLTLGLSQTNSRY